jgi:hypothetical protein
MALWREGFAHDRLCGTDRSLAWKCDGANNAHNWPWLGEAALLAAVRDDFPALIRPEDQDQILGHNFNTMMVAHTPPLLFDFDRLAALFASTMIPTQAGCRCSPAQIIGPE